MRDHADMSYRIDRISGQLCFRTSGCDRIFGNIDLALAWTEDQTGGCLYKHGSADLVNERAAAIRAVDPSVRVAIIPWKALSHPLAGPEIIDEVNACLAISGRISQLEERLVKISDRHEIELSPQNGRDAEQEMTP